MKKFLLSFAIFITSCASGLIAAETETAPITTLPPHIANVETPTNATPFWWHPLPGSSWQIQFTGEIIDTSLDVDIYDLDLFDTQAELIEELHAHGKHVICYLNAGAWEDWRPDAGDFPAEVIGADYEDWPGERWLDTSNLAALAPIMQARLKLCAEKGFDGVDPDNLDGFTNETGFELTQDEVIAYVQWLSEEAHSRGLAIGLKNVPELSKELEPYFEWALTESCFAQDWCEEMLPFIESNKPVFAIEYIEEGMQTSDFCPQAADLGVSAILKNLDLDAWAQTCSG